MCVSVYHADKRDILYVKRDILYVKRDLGRRVRGVVAMLPAVRKDGQKPKETSYHDKRDVLSVKTDLLILCLRYATVLENRPTRDILNQILALEKETY